MRCCGLVLAVGMCRPAVAPAPVVAETPARVSDLGSRRPGELRLRVEADPPAPGDAMQLVGGRWMICAARHERDLACFGDVGLMDTRLSRHAGSLRHSSEPVALTGFDAVVAVAAGRAAHCLLDTQGAARCWGHSLVWPASFTPAAPWPMPTDGAVSSIAASRHVYAVIEGSVRAWGASAQEERELSSLTDATAVASGLDSACALRRNGRVACWGAPLGERRGDQIHPPRAVVGVKAAVQLVMGRDHACARLRDGAVACWGDNDAGQLGAPGMARRVTAAPVPGAVRVVDLSAGWRDTCALRDDGVVTCWGPSLSPTERPDRVEGIGAAIDVIVARDFACALGVDRALRCFGAGRDRLAPDPAFERVDAWRGAAPLWDETDQDAVARAGAVQGFRAEAEQTLGELVYRLDEHCRTVGCTQGFPADTGPTIVGADGALRAWAPLVPSDRSVSAPVGARLQATTAGDTVVFTVEYGQKIFDPAVVLRVGCRLRHRPRTGPATLTHISCDEPELVAAP